MVKNIQLISEHYQVPYKTLLQMEADGVLNSNTLNRAVVHLLIDRYVRKHKTKVEAMRFLARDLGITEHTVQAFIYNNRNRQNHTCKRCDKQITAYYYYKKHGICKECHQKILENEHIQGQ